VGEGQCRVLPRGDRLQLRVLSSRACPVVASGQETVGGRGRADRAVDAGGRLEGGRSRLCEVSRTGHPAAPQGPGSELLDRTGDRLNSPEWTVLIDRQQRRVMGPRLAPVRSRTAGSGRGKSRATCKDLAPTPAVSEILLERDPPANVLARSASRNSDREDRTCSHRWCRHIRH
jgi:hypothetical protein